jgi:hypothetical protein
VVSYEKNAQILMNDIYIKIAGIESGNVILQIQNSGLTFHLFKRNIKQESNFCSYYLC